MDHHCMVEHTNMQKPGEPNSWSIRLIFQNKAVNVGLLESDGAYAREFSCLRTVGHLQPFWNRAGGQNLDASLSDSMKIQIWVSDDQLLLHH